MQTLTDFTNKEIRQFTRKEHERIESITKDKEMMLHTLNAETESDNPYKQALSLYPELLREAYTKETLKAIKKRWILDAKSGKIKCQNKRLFAIPDLYAACEFWFCGIKEPKGLLEDGVVACKVFNNYDKADVLRSPHLYREHSLQTITHDPNVYKWFYTKGIYTSCKSLISRILQFDVDGDQLNVVVDPIVVSVAERNIKNDNIIPLFYDANKAAPETLSYETMFKGLKRAHDYSGIGQVSNSLTKLWNRPHPDLDAAAWITYYNNLVIDAAKTGYINSYENYPEVNARINKAIGGKRGRLPYFFQYSKNGRKTQNDRLSKRKKFAKPNNSTMNRICSQFDDIGNINFNYAGVPPFNWQMLLSEPCLKTNNKLVSIFCEMDDSNFSNIIEMKEYDDLGVKENTGSYEILKESIIHELNLACGDYKLAYPYITKYLFTGENFNKASHKQMYWRIFGEIAVKNIINNLSACDVCPDCGMKVPYWVEKHTCIKNSPGFFECIDCGKICERVNSRQCRCEECQQAFRYTSKLANKRKNYKKKR